MESKVSMKKIVVGGYDDFWLSKQRYVVCKGSPASKKSTTAATLKDSCYAQLQWAINRLGVEKF